jgi:retinol-binding protein 3
MRIFKCQHLLVLFVLITPFTITAQVKNQQPIRVTDLINAISDSLDKHYIFPDQAGNISSYLHAQLKANAYTQLVNDPEKLAQQIGKDISTVYHDPHMRVQYDPGFVTQVAYDPTPEEMQQVKKYWVEHNYSFQKAEVLPGNIGYLSFNLFVGDIEAAKHTIKSALSFLANTDALIIDLRENMGGDPRMVSQVESYFFKEKTPMNNLINRSTKDTTFLFADPAKADSLHLDMPIYILTSKNTFSGAEDFSYGMLVAKRACLVGETTGGGAHPQMPFSVNQGFVVYIPFARSLNAVTHTDWEGTGVIPDVKIPAVNALNKARELIFKENLSKATDQKSKNKYLYFIHSVLESMETESLPANKLRPYTGTYGGITIYLVNNKLYCRNNNNGGSISVLKQLSNKLFVLDKEAQIEFKKDSQDKVTGISILVNDGSIFEETRSH